MAPLSWQAAMCRSIKRPWRQLDRDAMKRLKGCAEGATILSFSWDDPRCPDVCETVVLLAGIVWRYSIYHLYKSSKKVLPCISMIKRV